MPGPRAAGSPVELRHRVLSALGRIHSADRARKAYHTLRDAGFENINLDLMFGTPRETADGSRQVQDLEVWHHTLDEIFAMNGRCAAAYEQAKNA